MRGVGSDVRHVPVKKVKSLVRSFENLSSFKFNEIGVPQVRYLWSSYILNA